MRMICVKTALFIGALTLGCHASAAERAALQNVTVMSFNIRYGSAKDGENRWDNRKEQVAELIRQQGPDTVGLQEALRYQIDAIRERLPEYGEVGVGREGGTQGEYSAILYRTGRFDVAASGTFWLSDTPDVPSNTWGAACIRIATWARLVDKQTGRAFFHFNTHLDHVSQSARQKSVRLIASRIASRTPLDPFVLTGDFNAGEDNPAITYLNGAGESADRTPVAVVDAFRVLHPDAKEVGTFNGFRGQTDGAKIDFIFVDASTRVLEASIIRTSENGRYPSDHFPVSATLDLWPRD